MTNLSITINTILKVAAGIGILGGGVVVISRIFAPFKKLCKRLDRLEGQDEMNTQHLTALRETNQLLCRGVIGLLDHAITGNSEKKLEVIKEDMQDHLIEKQ